MISFNLSKMSKEAIPVINPYRVNSYSDGTTTIQLDIVSYIGTLATKKEFLLGDRIKW